MGYAVGVDPVQHTNPNFRSVYVLLIKPGAGLDGVDRLSDRRLQGKRLEIMAATPPADHLLEQGLLATSASTAALAGTGALAAAPTGTGVLAASTAALTGAGIPRRLAAGTGARRC